MIHSSFAAALMLALGLTSCSSEQVARKVVSPNAANLTDKERAWVKKVYLGMTMAVDGTPDTNREEFVTYAVIPGAHQVDITVYRLVDETGYDYKGPPVHWKGTITTKPDLFYEISAEPNTATNTIQIRMTSHHRPLVDYEENTVIGEAKP